MILKGGNYLHPSGLLRGEVAIDVLRRIRIPIILFGAGVQAGCVPSPRRVTSFGRRSFAAVTMAAMPEPGRLGLISMDERVRSLRSSFSVPAVARVDHLRCRPTPPTPDDAAQRGLVFVRRDL